MGVDIDTYRRRIGAAGGSFKFSCIPSYICMPSQSLVLLMIISMLLMIAGIEPNPGPIGFQSVQVLVLVNELLPVFWVLLTGCSAQNATVANVQSNDQSINTVQADSTVTLTTFQIATISVSAVVGLIAVTGFILTWFCMKPKLKSDPNTVTIDLADNDEARIDVDFEVMCSVHTDWIPPPTVDKGKCDKTKDSGRTSYTITNLSIGDAGTYKCAVTSKIICLPCLKSVKKVELEVKSTRPVMTKTYEDPVNKFEGETLELECQFTGLYTGEVAWLHDNVKIREIKVIKNTPQVKGNDVTEMYQCEVENISEKKFKATLRKLYIKHEDGGTYTCEVKNTGGEFKTETQLHVKDSLMMTKKYDEEVHKNEWEKLVLECQFTDLYTGHITWCKDNTQLDEIEIKEYKVKCNGVSEDPSTERYKCKVEGVSTNEKKATLTISSVRTEDNGMYTCQIKNASGHGEIKTEAHLSVKDYKELLITKYKEDKYHNTQVLPGECFELDVKDEARLMPIDFSVEKLEIDDREREVHEQKRKVKYVKYNSHGSSLDEILQDVSCRSALILADPGCGKSIYIKKLVSAFTNKTLFTKSNALFYLPVRNIPDINVPLSGILKSMEYLPEETMLDKIPSSLFLVDGIDEVTIPKKSELFQLIKGKHKLIRDNPKVKVIISSRPESPILQMLRPLNYDYKILIAGTTTEGVHSYLSNISSEGENAKQEIKDLVASCEKQMVDFKLLHVPLYLTIVRYVFDAYYKERLSFQHFAIPNTATKLFGALITIFLRVWLDKMGMRDEAKSLYFVKSPLDENSNLPESMKRTLFALGKMSYECLNDEIYNFTSVHFRTYHISVKEAKNSGLFCFSDKHDEVFFRHKQLREFMAAMYLSSNKMEKTLFLKRMPSNEKKNEKSTLLEVFQGIESMMYFTFGLSPEFALEILNKLKGHVNVACGKHGQKVNIHYESRLSYESDQAVTEAMRVLLLDSTPVEKKTYIKSPVSTIYSLLKGLTNDQKDKLLEMWHNIKVWRDAEVDSVILSDMDGAEHSLHIREVNDALFFIMHSYSCHNVKSLMVGFSDVSNVRNITQVFPYLEKLAIRLSGNTDLDNFIDTNLKPQVLNPQNTLTRVKMKTLFQDFPLPSSSVVSLLEQTELQSLKLDYVNIFSTINKIQSEILWSKLSTLEILMHQLDDENCSEYFNGLCVILKSTPMLNSLTWGYVFNTTTPAKHVHDLSMLLSELPNLDILRLGLVWTTSANFTKADFHSPIDLDYIQTLCANLKTVTTLGLGWVDVKGREKEWVKYITEYGKHLNKIQIWYRGSRDTSSVVEKMQKLIKPHAITVEGWEWQWE